VGNNNSYWGCRISGILAQDQVRAKKRGYAPMRQDVPHSQIRRMMEELCVHCGEPLDWERLGVGKTPHLDHDHETGEVNGFSHSSCNPRALKNMIEKLKADCAQFKRAA